MAVRTRRPDRRMITDINITPFTDVCLVLLIIFMVTATFLGAEAGLGLKLPRAATAQAPLPKSVTIRITKTGQTYLDKALVGDTELEARLIKIRNQYGTRLVVIKADSRAVYHHVIRAIDAARMAGLDQVALAADKLPSPPRSNRLTPANTPGKGSRP